MDYFVGTNMNPLQRSQSKWVMCVFLLACAGVAALRVVELSETFESSVSFFGQACCFYQINIIMLKAI